MADDPPRARAVDQQRPGVRQGRGHPEQPRGAVPIGPRAHPEAAQPRARGGDAAALHHRALRHAAGAHLVHASRPDHAPAAVSGAAPAGQHQEVRPSLPAAHDAVRRVRAHPRLFNVARGGPDGRDGQADVGLVQLGRHHVLQRMARGPGAERAGGGQHHEGPAGGARGRAGGGHPQDDRHVGQEAVRHQRAHPVHDVGDVHGL
mmetsp:Transcript_63179/g.152499  ORF Transcript_63179/g.152499 Transcript_63179/m.152499 type:complete len:204 (+) Transcript_63179:252-863(+)